MQSGMGTNIWYKNIRIFLYQRFRKAFRFDLITHSEIDGNLFNNFISALVSPFLRTNNFVLLQRQIISYYSEYYEFSQSEHNLLSCVSCQLTVKSI
jgi:hypothetical protein